MTRVLEKSIRPKKNLKIYGTIIEHHVSSPRYLYQNFHISCAEMMKMFSHAFQDFSVVDATLVLCLYL